MSRDYKPSSCRQAATHAQPPAHELGIDPRCTVGISPRRSSRCQPEHRADSSLVHVPPARTDRQRHLEGLRRSACPLCEISGWHASLPSGTDAIRNCRGRDVDQYLRHPRLPLSPGAISRCGGCGWRAPSPTTKITALITDVAGGAVSWLSAGCWRLKIREVRDRPPLFVITEVRNRTFCRSADISVQANWRLGIRWQRPSKPTLVPLDYLAEGIFLEVRDEARVTSAHLD
jgi:hypothetical protein